MILFVTIHIPYPYPYPLPITPFLAGVFFFFFANDGTILIKLDSRAQYVHTSTIQYTRPPPAPLRSPRGVRCSHKQCEKAEGVPDGVGVGWGRVGSNVIGAKAKRKPYKEIQKKKKKKKNQIDVVYVCMYV